ncbi:beta-ketoacyl-[acyl-carrier-protein] synthase family protein [Streptacidiphilus anmyonensis]|uniref:beta-ketoacyl-[acyl-carrier-protein] synthase family protein n=1 Tax=Streptacidiphilus anmyonensis TaxID=405782 RepID=UPI0005A6916B|nr:beta-ketoacyl-[acyl-carrier-protein] synthase family protein [Streptacidiphilus anmyonensis]
MARELVEVAITGLGASTPLGGDVASTWAAMLDGRSGVALMEDPWARELPVRIAARLAVEPTEVLSRVEARKLDRCEQLALVTAREAWADAARPEVAPERLAVVIGTGTGGVGSLLAQDDALEQHGARKVSPYVVTQMMANGPAAWVSMDLGARGGARTPVSACSSGAEAIAMGLDLIRLGRADVVVAGGTEACIAPLPLAGFAQMTALSKREDAPEAASRPFDVDRDGFVLGEGAAVVVLERADRARARGARVYAHVAGAGITSSAVHITASDADGQRRAIRQALADAEVDPLDVGVVHAHATSTPPGDLVEAQVIAETIGLHPVVTATKSMTGHLLGASGALGAVVTALALHDGQLPAVRNLENVDPEVKLDLVTGTPRRGAWRAGLANSYGFGGHNVSLVLTGA